MATNSKRVKNLKFGDEILYKNHKCVVLERFSDGMIDRYHIFGPEVGVYTAFEDEIKHTGHVEEADALFQALNAECVKKTA